jgi:hypothetical protein
MVAHLALELRQVVFKVDKLESGDVFVTVVPLVAVMVVRAVGRNLRVVISQELAARPGVVVLESVVHTARLRRAFDGEEPNSRAVPEGMLGVNKYVAICYPYYRPWANRQ